MNGLETRINILKEAGQIAEDSVKLAQVIYDYFLESLDIQLTEETGAMLITHVVMAHERIKKNEPVEELNDIIVKQIEVDANFEKANCITQEIIEFFGDNFIQAEKNYILMHVLNLIKGVL